VQPIGVSQHDIVETAALLVAERAGLQRFQVQADRRDWRLQLVGDRVDERVVLLVAPYFEHEKDRVDDESGDDQAEGDDAEEEDPQRRALGRDDDPADVQLDRPRDQQNAQGDEKRDRLLTPSHGENSRNSKCKIQNATAPVHDKGMKAPGLHPQ